MTLYGIHTRALSFEKNKFASDGQGTAVAKATIRIQSTRAISLLLSHPPSPRHAAIANRDHPPTLLDAPPCPQAISVLSEDGKEVGGGGKASRELEVLLLKSSLCRERVY